MGGLGKATCRLLSGDHRRNQARRYNASCESVDCGTEDGLFSVEPRGSISCWRRRCRNEPTVKNVEDARLDGMRECELFLLAAPSSWRRNGW